MVTLTLILSAIVNWKTPDPIQGFDRWEPAALFWIEDAFGDRQVDEGPNHDKLNVSKTSIETRSYLEFDLEALPEEFDLITLNIIIANSDRGPPVEVIEFFDYAGDGEEGLDDWNAGVYFWTYDNPHPLDEQRQRMKLDVGELVRRYRNEGRRYLGFRLSAPSFARFSIGKSGGEGEPNPFLAVHHERARTDSSDVQPFVECMVGPDDIWAARCPLLWDYNEDDVVDLADYAIFQAMFDE
jgi:hypothetical protein